MPSFSETSTKRLETCDTKLVVLFNSVVCGYDCSILEGHRNQEDQNKKYSDGKSKLRWPYGMHNRKPSQAVDVAPYPIDWAESGTPEKRQKALVRFYHFAGYVLKTAEEMGIPVRWGGDWDSDKDFFDQEFDDLVHWELR